MTSHHAQESGTWRFKPYPVYKESGVEWLSEIPAHWEVKPLKALLARNDSGVWGEDFDDDGVIVLRSTEQTVDGHWSIQDPARRRLSMREAATAKLAPGDLVTTKSSGSQAHIGKTSIVDETIATLNCCFSNFMQRLRVSASHQPRFFWYLLNCPVGREQLVYRSSTTTGLGNLNGTILGSLTVPMPRTEEQRAIAAFLDREAATIDALVAKKERLIELLQEKRTALITRAVTKGLDPNVPMKDSGVEWLGEIPAHWTEKRVRQLCTRVTDGAHISPDTSSTDFPFVSTVDIRGGVIDFDGCLRTSRASYSYMERTGCRPKDGDVLFSKDGTVGTTAVVTTDRAFAVASSLVILSPDKNEVDPRWLNYWLNGIFIKDQVGLLLSGAALRRISVAKVGRLPVLLPPKLDEQRDIIAVLDRENKRIDALVTKVREAIDRLKELRTALISAAMTGKIDVREHAA